jgi:hypothetical protein
VRNKPFLGWYQRLADQRSLFVRVAAAALTERMARPPHKKKAGQTRRHNQQLLSEILEN